MNLDILIKKLLKEIDDPKSTSTFVGLNYNDQYDILKKGRDNCSGFAELIKGRDIKEFPSSEIYKFPELNGQTKVAYVSTPEDNQGIKRLFFGIKDGLNANGKTQFLSYAIQRDKNPKKYGQGWGADCDKLQELSQLGVDTLPPEQKKILDDYLVTHGDTTSKFEPTANMGEWKKKPYTEVIPDYKGSGYFWERTNLANSERNVLGDTETLLDQQGFTRDERNLDAASAEANYPILLKDLIIYYPSLQKAAEKSPNTVVYLKKGTFPVPTRESCRTVIKLLTKCSKMKGGAPSECYQGLLKNKYLAIQCQNKNFLSGIFGVGDEFKKLQSDNTNRFGLGSLSTALQNGLTQKAKDEQSQTSQANYSIKETLKERVSRVLNEEFKKIHKY
jgi:hypothetical protein